MIIRTWQKIADETGQSVSTVRRWAKYHGFPVAPAPNGEMMITTDLINQWILARAQNYRQSRGKANNPPDHS